MISPDVALSLTHMLKGEIHNKMKVLICSIIFFANFLHNAQVINLGNYEICRLMAEH